MAAQIRQLIPAAEVRLFGSRARGQARPDSDQVPRWDVAFAGGAVAVAEFGSPCASLQLKWKVLMYVTLQC